MFVTPQLDEILIKMNQLDSNSSPRWGSMNAMQMVEHLTDLNFISSEKVALPLQTPEKYLPKYLQFLEGEDKMPRNFKVDFVTVAETRHEQLDDAIDEFVESWLEFEDCFEENPSKTVMHPLYGPLNFEQWKRLHSKHITHHLEQFGLIE